jgi:hypothetical protein
MFESHMVTYKKKGGVGTSHLEKMIKEGGKYNVPSPCGLGDL